MGRTLMATIAGLAVMASAAWIAPVARAADAPTRFRWCSPAMAMAQNRKDVKEDVVKLCEGKVSCKFKVANKTFSAKEPADPSPGDDKGVMIAHGWGEGGRRRGGGGQARKEGEGPGIG